MTDGTFANPERVGRDIVLFVTATVLGYRILPLRQEPQPAVEEAT
jgi:hypothetical protein